MAATSTSYSSSHVALLQKLAFKYGFDDIVIQDEPISLSTRIMVRVGSKTYAAAIAHRDQIAGDDKGNIALIEKALADLSRKSDRNNDHTLDMRWNNIESMADVMALLHRAKNDMRNIKTFIFTPDQHKILMKELDPMGMGVQDGYLYGAKIEVMGQ